MHSNVEEYIISIGSKTNSCMLKVQLVRKDMDVDVHEWLPNVTLRYKLKLL
jgi:hypothetical protein